MNRLLISKWCILLLCISNICNKLHAHEASIHGPDKQLVISVSLKEGIPGYSVKYKGITMLEDSPLGLIADIGDYSKNMSYSKHSQTAIGKEYIEKKIKKSHIRYDANELRYSIQNERKQTMDIVFLVSNNDIAIRYELHPFGETACCVIEKETTGFNFPAQTTTFLTPQSTPMIGWKRTKPSYEETYKSDEPIGTPSQYGLGYTFPGLFHIGKEGWVLLSETGVSSLYCGTRLSEGTKEGLYTIAFPEPGENNGIGSAYPAISLPGKTPWRTITVGDNLHPIVETTVPFDVVDVLYEPSQEYKFGRSTWSWIMWQDNSINYEDQIKYIDLAAEMRYEYVLIDGLWDKQIGYEQMPALFRYAQSKGVDVFVWYNSNGFWNDAPQGARHKMNSSIARKKEMKWLQSLGVKGLKVDFFGGDKQQTMQLYEDILSDANEYGLMVIFHGCTLPRGWERMYPNYVGSEAVLASENLIFTQTANENEAYNACLHPFIRNAVGSMEFGPVLLNKRHNRTNNGGTIRRTTDIFQLATAILFQNPVQMFAIAPNNLTDVPAFEIEFMKNVPTTWDDTRFIDGYPGKYCVLARRHNDNWYVVAVNGQNEPIKLDCNLPMLRGKTVIKYFDNKKREACQEVIQVRENTQMKIELQAGSAVIYVSQ